MKIGVFDSGIGGITVLNHLRVQFPGYRFLYFGDTANVPYGSKSVAQIQELVDSAARRIKKKKLDALVIACNTASSLALEKVKEIMAPVPVLGVVEAGVQAILNSPESQILILGTRATVESHVYARLLKSHLPSSHIYEQACPLLVPMIEEGWLNHPVLDDTIKEYVKPFQGILTEEKKGVALLACTHYPWVRESFEKALPGWKVIDSAEAVSRQLRGLWSHQPVSYDQASQVTWFFSDPTVVASFMEIKEKISRF